MAVVCVAALAQTSLPFVRVLVVIIRRSSGTHIVEHVTLEGWGVEIKGGDYGLTPGKNLHVDVSVFLSLFNSGAPYS